MSSKDALDDAPAPVFDPEAADTIKSFVRRKGRMTIAQRDALELEWSRFCLEWPSPMGQAASQFERAQPLVMEIGFGNGEALAAAAARDPERNYLGVEVHLPGVGHLLHVLSSRQISNARILCADAVAVLKSGIEPGSLDEVRLYSPWHYLRMARA